jgi:serine/threonine protein kinase/Tol biopolymer transport system component
MGLTPGTRLGQYEVESVIAAGGMGEIYKALDTKLNRPVAVKVLSDDLADANGRRRFQREAQMASSLNHPHILTIHDVGELDGRQYLVTEFVDGGTLRDWRAGGTRTWRQIVELLVGVADGLAAAHASGILHRDIKPENVLVTTSGYAKLADFGLAKLNEGDPKDDAPTIAQIRTRVGTIVGTIGYMSPEQALGRPLDARSDIFSFGVMLYEMFAGVRPFPGPSDLMVLQAIAHAAPAPLGRHVPPGLREIVAKTLEKDPADRYQSARELVVDLRRLLRQSDDTSARRISRRNAALAAGAVLVLAAAALAVGRWLRPPAATAREVAPQQYVQLTSFSDAVVSPSLSADGRMLTYIRGDSPFVARGEIYVQVLPDGEPVQLTHDGRQKMSPVFSPDGSRIAYTVVFPNSEWDTWTVPVLGGEPRQFMINASGLTWIRGAETPHVLFSEHTREGIHMVLTTASEGRLSPRRVYAPPSVGGMAHRSFASPDGRSVLVVEMGSGWLPCQLVPFDGSAAATVVGPPNAPCTDAAWSPDGQWMYLSANAGNGFHIWRQKAGERHAEQVTAAAATEEQGVAVLPDGRSLVTSIGSEQNTVWLHDAGGDRQITSQGYAYEPMLSPDGKRLYYLLRSGVSVHSWVSGALWVSDLQSGQRERLFPDFLIEDYNLSSDGTRVVFSALAAEGPSTLWIGALDRAVAPRRLADVKSSRAIFGPDDAIYFVQSAMPFAGLLHRINADGTGLKTLRNERVAYLYGLSADGQWAALWKGESVVLTPLTGGAPIELCAACATVGAENRGVTPPVVSWARNGKYLYLHSAWTTRETFSIPLAAGRIAPALPDGGIRTVEDIAALSGARRIPQLRAFMGDDPSVYVFLRATPQRNIYRVPLR